MNKQDKKRNAYMLAGKLSKRGYDWWWHSFTAYNHETGEEKPFFFEFFIINPQESNSHELNQNVNYAPTPSYVMVNAGTWGEDGCQLHRFAPASELTAATDHLHVEVADCILTEYESRGRVRVTDQMVKEHPEYLSDAGTIEWNLKINKKVAFHVGYGASAFFRWLNAFAMFWHAQGMMTQYEGTVRYNGVLYDVIPEKSYGYADKNWGKDFTSPWVWISSCHMKSLITGKVLHDTVFDIGGGRPVVFGIPLNRKLLSNLWYEGEDLEFNFSKFWTGTKTTFEFREEKDIVVWKIKTRNRHAMLLLECRCPKKDMIKIRYQAPDGEIKHKNLFNGGNGYGVFRLYKKYSKNFELVDKVAFRNAGCEYGEYSK